MSNYGIKIRDHCRYSNSATASARYRPLAERPRYTCMADRGFGQFGLEMDMHGIKNAPGIANPPGLSNINLTNWGDGKSLQIAQDQLEQKS